MRRSHVLLLLFAALLGGPAAHALGYYFFEHYTTHEGLPSNTIHCIYQDSFGFVWIGTRDGLTRFDGYDFRSPVPSGGTNITTLASVDIAEDEDGLIWFSTTAGIGCYNPGTGETQDLGRMGSGNVSFDIQPDMKGSIWLTGDKIYRYEKATGGLKAYATGSSMPRKIVVDSYDAVWAILADGSLYFYNKRGDVFNQADIPWRLTLLEPAGDGRILATTTAGDVLLINTINLTQEPRTVFSSAGRSDDLEIRNILERRSGEYWIGTNRGLFVSNTNDGSVSHIRHLDADSHSLSANLVTCLSKDKAGNIWSGTYYNGINIWQDKQDGHWPRLAVSLG